MQDTKQDRLRGVIRRFQRNLLTRMRTEPLMTTDFLLVQQIATENYLIDVVTLRDENPPLFPDANDIILELVDILVDLSSRRRIVGNYRARSRSRSRQSRRKGTRKKRVKKSRR